MALCEEPSREDRIRGNYENKIRFFSPPEKTYEIFATEKTEDGELRMSYKDFLRSMTPYCHTPFFEGTEEYLKNYTPDILKKVDADDDGQVSFTEFFFFIVLLQIQPRKILREFKKIDNGDGLMSKEEASQVLRTLRKSTQAGQKQQDRVKLDARAIKSSEEDFKHTNLAIVEKFFAGKEHITVDDLIEMQYKFREDLWHYQFHSFEPNEDGRISTENFLKANLPSVTGRFVEKYKR